MGALATTKPQIGTALVVDLVAVVAAQMASKGLAPVPKAMMEVNRLVALIMAAAAVAALLPQAQLLRGTLEEMVATEAVATSPEAQSFMPVVVAVVPELLPQLEPEEPVVEAQAVQKL